MIACVYYANPPHLLSVELAILGPVRMSLSDHGPITPWQPCHCSVLAEVPFALLCLSVPHGVQAKFIFLGEFLDWPKGNEQSRRDHGRAEASSITRLQSSNKLLTNKFLASHKFQLQAVNKCGCFCYVSFFAFACMGICFVSDFMWNRENRQGLDKERKGKDSCAITRWGAGTNDRAAG